MSFASPPALLALLIVPLLLAGYLWQLRRKRKQAVRYSSVALIRLAIPKRSRWHRHVPVALFLAAITALAIGSARPRVSADVPINKTSIILTLDVSGSMCSTDVTPNRLTAAQNAAKEFIKNQVAGTRIGLIAFASFAQLIVPPTTDKRVLTRAVDELTIGRGTVIGAATLQAIDAIASVDPNVAPVDADVGATANQGGRRDTSTSPPPDTTPAPVPPQGYVPDIVVLLTDGANTRGISPVDAAKQAAARRVRVYTIGFGTDNPAAMVCSAAQLGAGAFEGGPGNGGGGFGGGNGGNGGRRNFLVRDEATLKAVAAATGGKYYQAEDAGQLRDVFAKLPSDIHNQHEEHEISVWFVLAGALLAVGAIGLSLRWNRT
ncbi:MAG: VWA domain-containing protein [Ilumatobacteraceae bacterium]